MSKPEVEGWIVDLAAQSNGVDRLNDLRDRARSLAATLEWERVFDRLNKLVSRAWRSIAESATPALQAGILDDHALRK